MAAGILTFSAAFAQTTTNHIELVVSESVELKPTEAEIRISLQTAQSQRESIGYGYGYSEYDYGYSWLEPTDEDYAYEQLMYENPKKVTKKMTEEYEARQKQREEEMAKMELEREEQERQREIRMASYEAIDVETVMAILTESGISFTIVTESTELEDRYEYDYDDWSDEYYEMETYYSDSVFSVKVTDAKAYENLLVTIDDLPVYSVVHDVKFEASETINSTVIPKLTEKATKEAQALANSFGRKLGKVIQCSNIHPYTPSENYMKNYMDGAIDVFSGDSEYGDEDPFNRTKKEIIEYVYRFELLN